MTVLLGKTFTIAPLEPWFFIKVQTVFELAEQTAINTNLKFGEMFMLVFYFFFFFAPSLVGITA